MQNGMLALDRNVNESIVIDPRDCPVDENGLITVMVLRVRGQKVKLGINAPRPMPVHRAEVWEEIQRQNRPKLGGAS